MKLIKNISRLLTFDDAVEKRMCERSHLFFSRKFFYHRQSAKFIVNWHHKLICDTVQEVLEGKIKNVVINVSPGSSKTELIVINLIARGLALNPWARFLHLSYSDDLALLNSSTARGLVCSDEFQTLWPMGIAEDSKAKKRWNVLVDGKPAGGVYATSLGGQITGFRAGHMSPGFQGALLIDDPLKPDDAHSKPKLDHANRLLINTVQSRLAKPDTPIIVIMQRVAEMDPTGFIQGGNLGSDWKFLKIPALIDEDYVAQLPEQYQADVKRDGNPRFSYWPEKEKAEKLLAMERGEGNDQAGSRMSRHVFASQYQQTPVAIGGNIIRGEWFDRWVTEPREGCVLLPKLRYRKIFADTAQKTGERNDYSVFQCWGFGVDGKAYLLDQIRGKWEAPELERKAIEFWNKHKALNSADLGALRGMWVEDKSSGTGLIQKIRLLNHIIIKPIERVKDKLTRVMDVVGYIESHLVAIPADGHFTADFVVECEAFTADDTHAFDDQIDPLCDAVNDILSTQNKLETWRKII